MTTELEQEFFKVFGIEPHWQYKVHQFCHFYYCDKKTIIKNTYLFQERKTCKVKEVKRVYPEITDRKLLQLLCIYNDMQGCVEMCITPCKYEDVKEMTLHFLIDEKTSITDYEEGTYMDVMTNQIQQLFKEEE